jgi:dihydrofolate synthase/folylpolyglutamate synthase
LIFAQKCFRCLEHNLVEEMQHIAIERVEDSERYDLRLDLLGDYQFNNVITAATAIHILHSSTPLTISRRAFVDGLASVVKTTHLAGRWQILGREPFVVCDTGHNAHGLKWVTEQLRRVASKYTRQICVVGFAREKNLDEILPMLPHEAYYIFTQANISRALPAAELAAKAKSAGLTGEVVVGVAEAVAKARGIAQPSDMIFIGGSNFVIAEVL